MYRWTVLVSQGSSRVERAAACSSRRYQLEYEPSLRYCPAYQDAFAQALVRWAKDDFLKWADPLKCSECGGATVGVSSGLPSPQEERDGAGRVELYRCVNTSSPCHGKITRFPRYTNLEKLLQTRTGRCGEFAAVFMLLLRALDLRARYIWNSEDHVWNEYYSEDMKRWVHLDSCEGARDKNLLYERGWGKKMKVGSMSRNCLNMPDDLNITFQYCIAFGADGVKDVTRSYVSDWPATLSRRDASLESALASQLSDLTRQRRVHLTPSERTLLDEEDMREEAWLGDFKKREEELEKEELVGRTSGTKEWRAQRSETGSQKNAVPSMKGAYLHMLFLGCVLS
jgi:peptide-N4-(N-acetyl-beta-glucosaminyl)asparagine amidase